MGSSPKAPDPYAQADAQNSQNMQAAFTNSIMGNADTYNPYGSTTNRISGYVPYTDPTTGRTTQIPRWTQTTALSPVQQGLFNTENRVKGLMGSTAEQQLGNLKKVLGKPFNQKGLQDWEAYGEGPQLKMEQGPTDRAAIEKNMMDSYYRGVQPQQEAENAQYAAKGMGAPGSKYGYDVANQRADAAGEQTRQAYNASGEESRAAMEAQNKALQQMMLNTRAGSDQRNALRQSQFAMNSAERNQWVNEIAALLGGGQATIPSATPFQGGQVNPFDIAGAQNNQYNIKAQQSANKMSGIAGVAGGIMSILPFI